MAHVAGEGESAQGQVSGSWDKPPVGSGGGPNADKGGEYDLDMSAPDNQYPMQTGSDSYEGIPGDGKVPG